MPPQPSPLRHHTGWSAGCFEYSSTALPNTRLISKKTPSKDYKNFPLLQLLWLHIFTAAKAFYFTSGQIICPNAVARETPKVLLNTVSWHPPYFGFPQSSGPSEFESLEIHPGFSKRWDPPTLLVFCFYVTKHSYDNLFTFYSLIHHRPLRMDCNSYFGNGSEMMNIEPLPASLCASIFP